MLDFIMIETDQIIRINSYIADYAIYPSELTNSDQFFAAYVKDMPKHMELQLASMCNDMRLFCTFVTQKNSEGQEYRMISVWSYDYKPAYL